MESSSSSPSTARSAGAEDHRLQDHSSSIIFDKYCDDRKGEDVTSDDSSSSSSSSAQLDNNEDSSVPPMQTLSCCSSASSRLLSCICGSNTCWLDCMLRVVKLTLVVFLLMLVTLGLGVTLQQRKVDQEQQATVHRRINRGVQPPLDSMLKTNNSSADGDVPGQQNNHVCGLLHNRTSNAVKFESFSSVSSLNGDSAMDATGQQNDTTTVAHCGDCGSCSNPQDIGIYADTTESLLIDTTDCAKKAIFGGRGAAERCMLENVGFTEGCTDCWVDNIQCDLRKCVFICMWHGLWHGGVDAGGGDTDQPTSLNPCTHCDEIRCGPEFIACAGANRRTSGILSDIKRDEGSEVCNQVTHKGWYRDETIISDWMASISKRDDANR